MKVSLAADKLGCNKTALVGPIFVVAPGLDIILKRNSNYQQHILDKFMKSFFRHSKGRSPLIAHRREWVGQGLERPIKVLLKHIPLLGSLSKNTQRIFSVKGGGYPQFR